MKNFLLFSVMLLMGHSFFAQSTFNSEAEFNKMISIPNSPESQAFGNYGNIPVDLRVGAPKVSVPLYNYKGRELDLSVALSYDINARKVEDIASGVGMGWNLNVGGRISRNTRGLPDDYSYVQTGVGEYETLLLNPSLRNKLHTFKDKDIANGSVADRTFGSLAEAQDYFTFLDRVQNGSYDVTLDNFSLNAPGLNDHIALVVDDSDPANITIEAIAVNNPRIKVEYTTSGVYPNIYISSWTISNDNGVKYVFETPEETRSFNGLDVNDPFGSPGGPIQIHYNSSWLLTSMTSANEKDVYQFEYLDFVPWGQEINTWDSKQIDTPPPPSDPNGAWSQRLIPAGSKYSISQKALEYIIHNEDTIVNITLGGRNDFVNDSKVESITTISPIDGSLINHFKFNYDYFGPINSNVEKELRLKLDKIEISGKGYTGSNHQFDKEYAFTYLSPELMPARDSKSQDMFGYYNGKPNGNNLIPIWEISGQTLAGADRSFDFSKASIGILKEIYYPTGGHTFFEYESPLDGEGNDLPNVRVASMSNYTDGGTIATKKEYLYPENEMVIDAFIDPEPKLKYYTSETIDLGGVTTPIYHRMAKAVLSDQPYISYKKVIEKNLNTISPNENNGETVYEFDSSQSASNESGNLPWPIAPFPISYHGNVSKGKMIKQIIKNGNDETLSVLVNNYTAPPGSNESYFDETYYAEFSIRDEPSRAIQFVQRTDNGSGGFVVNYIDGVPSGVGGFQPPNNCNNCLQDNRYARLQPLKTYTVTQYAKKENQVATETFEGSNITSSSTFIYDPNIEYLKREEFSTTSESGKINITRYNYPKDFLGDPILDLLPNQSSPVTTQTYQSIAGVEELLGNQRIEYKSVVTNVGNQIFQESINTSRRGDDLQIKMLFQDYDNDGNIVQMSKIQGTPVSYIWGYDGRFVVAKIENIVYGAIPISLIDAIKNASSSQSSTASENNLWQALENLRNHPNMSNAMISSYTYKPNFEVSSITDLRGYTTHFYYDDENRLEYMTDEEGNVLTRSEYNYRINN